MRKLKLQVQISMDGFIARPNGEMDFMIWNWDDQLINYIQKITDPVDCILLGRKLAEGFIPHWAAVAENPNHPEHEAGRKFTDTKKIVFSKTLNKAEGNNTVLAQGDLTYEIEQLKNEPGKDLMVYGGASFVSALLKRQLIDELHLFINPTIVGKGMAIFNEVEQLQNFKLKQAYSFECGIALLNYELIR